MKREDKAGLELTIIVHLVVLIILLTWSLAAQLSEENSFILDFSKQDQAEELEQKKVLQEKINERIEEQLAQARHNSPVHNIVTSHNLSDDRNSTEETEQLYRDADRLAAELKAGYKPAIEEDAVNETADINSRKKEPEKSYSGPSVLSWRLEGRKASHLPIPAYQCYGAGDVTVAISVDQQGNVVNAKVVDSISSEDECLRNFAIRAARLSKFNRSTTAPLRQAGEIVYAFIAQ